MKNNNLTKGSVPRTLLGFFFPMLFMNMMQQLYSFADTVIVGKGLGDDALAAVGNISSISVFATGFAMGITGGFGIVISKAYGSGDMRYVRRLVACSIKISAIVSLILTAVGILFLKPLMFVMQTDNTILFYCTKYGYIIFSGFSVTMFYNLLSSVLRASGDSKTPFIAIAVSSAVNILLDCLFIFVLHTGIGGAAAATVSAQLISVVICIPKLKKYGFISFEEMKSKSQPQIKYELIKNGIPMAMMNSVTSAGCIIVQSFVNGLGVIYTSAYSACVRYINLFMLPSLTAGFAVSSFTGQNFGAKEYKRIKSGVSVGLMIAAVSFLFIFAGCVFFSDNFAALMLSESKTIYIASRFLQICGSFFLILNFIFIYRNTVQALGKPFIPMCSGIVEMAVRIAVIVIFLPHYGFDAAAFAEAAAWTAAFIINFAAYKFYNKSLF